VRAQWADGLAFRGAVAPGAMLVRRLVRGARACFAAVCHALQMESRACLSCGACCFGAHERYVPVSGSDYAQLDELAAPLTVFHGNRCYMRMHGGHCAALEIHANGEFYCSVYDRRPAVCRDLQRGSSACEAEYVRKKATSHEVYLRLLRSHTAANDAVTSRSRPTRMGQT